MHRDLDISFKTRKLAKLCNSRDAARKKWGTERGDKVMQRLNEMRAADTLADLMRLPQAKCHSLRADLKGQWSVDLPYPYRLLFIPANDPLPLKADGSVDKMRVTAVVVLGVEDTHG
jgi:plasmid maintenance system killer protein